MHCINTYTYNNNNKIRFDNCLGEGAEVIESLTHDLKCI